LYALGIEHIGEGASDVIASRLHRLEDLIALTPDALMALPGIGEINARAIQAFFESDAKGDMVRQLDQILRYSVAEKKTEGPLNGWVVVITGTLSMSRQAMTDKLERFGAVVVNALRKDVTHCLFGHDAGSTYTKAMAKGVTMLDEPELDEVLPE
jgi:NAD-dependent DNA ligase